jgi:hypothetical protein
VFNLNFHFRGHKQNKVPLWAKKLLLIKTKPSSSARLLLKLKNLKHKKSSPVQVETDTDLAGKESEKVENKIDNKMSLLICDPSIIALKATESEDENYNKKKLIRQKQISYNLTTDEEGEVDVDGDRDEDGEDICRDNGPKNINKQPKNTKHEPLSDMHKIQKLLKYSIRKIDKNLLQKYQIQNQVDEWKEVARRIDFILCIISIIFVIALPVLLFGKYLIYPDKLVDATEGDCTCGIHS